MGKGNKLLLVLCFFVLLSACSTKNSSENAKMDEYSQSSGEVAIQTEMDVEEMVSDTENAVDKKLDVVTSDRKIIHQAQLHLNVENIEQSLHSFEKKVNDYGGYIVESNVYRENEDAMNGMITVRIPEKHFQPFLKDAEGEATKVLERNVTGLDVTEQYVDLESRLKSKRVVEERLLNFMEKAEKTEDLLKISDDLSKVQEEMEVLVGQIKYLENQTSYSTINISMQESRVVVPGIDNKNLNTWEKTKKQLVTSTNFILSAISGLTVLIIGNIPVILLLLIIGAVIYFKVKRKKKNQDIT
ncbi:DUF4349 domain-containing protein [Lederbergia lenta]|uniref:DUF4349 domain-containing protein n=1 Tax=Lederbergia lenta TaxID=1467 RepID=A0A2X4W960_LEDLE|nr:DUF4349 domain-containing protein [Lederbergia lenta]MCM3109639.1 DUF4349 domain-containing protein [Lederbergia lenta]MEC2324609.1 DUF4349 domain-containing protein [Lederbergia lenta]SQI59279.1 Uncharacterised protein [Lederbergia lenta]